MKPISKKERTEDLAVEIAFLEGLRRRMPADAEVLKLLAQDYTTACRWEEGLEVDQVLSKLLRRDSEVHYNLACSLSLVGKLKAAAEALARAIQLGYRDWDWMQEDADMANLRRSLEFEPIAQMMSSLPKTKS